MDNGMDTGMGTGSVTGEELDVENIFHEDINSSDGTALNRNELMKLTGKKLARMAQPYSSKTLKVLEKTAKATLCDLIMSKSEKKPQEENKTHARTGTAKSESENFIHMAVSMLDAMKRSRDEEPLNAMVTDIFTKQAVVYADEKVANDEMNINKANTALFAIAGGALLFDGLVGFRNAPTLFSKLKNKFFKKVDKKPKQEQ